MLEGKNILFISPNFYDYSFQIKSEIELQGGNVVYYPERPSGFIYRIFRKIEFLKRRMDQSYLQNIIKNIKPDIKFDFFFLVRGEIVDEFFIKNLREAINDDVVFIMHQWDSCKMNNYSALIPFFNHVSTFDPKDAAALNIRYVPLFHANEYEMKVSKDQEDIDLLYIVYGHSDRISFLKNLILLSKAQGLVLKYYVYLDLFVFLKWIIQRKLHIGDIRFIRFTPLTLAEVIGYYKKAKAIVDIQHSNQDGLTSRSIEALGAGKLLITTNKNISEYCNSDQIRIIDREDFKLDKSWLVSDLDRINVPRTLKQWIPEVFFFDK